MTRRTPSSPRTQPLRRAEWALALLFAAAALLVVPIASFVSHGLPGFETPSASPKLAVAGRPFDLGTPYRVASSFALGLGDGSRDIALQPASEQVLPPETLEWFVPAADGGVWVMDRPAATVPRSRVRLFAEDGSLHRSFLLPAGAAILVPASDGGLWVDFAKGQGATEVVRRYDERGKRLAEFPLPSGVFARSLSVAPTGELWAQVEESEVDPETYATTYKSTLIPVAIGQDLHAAPDPSTGKLAGNFIGADGRLYSASAKPIPKGKEASFPASTLTAKAAGGKVETYGIPEGWRPYAADAQGRVYAERVIVSDTESLYHGGVGEAALGATDIAIFGPAGRLSRIPVTRPVTSAGGLMPAGWPTAEGELLVLERESAAIRLAYLAPASAAGPEPLPAAASKPPEAQLIAGMPVASGDPYSAADPLQRDVFRLVYAGLVRHDASLAPVPDMAERVPVPGSGVSPDGLTITYRLREGLRWHDGTPVTAEDVAATWRYLSSPAVAPRGRPFAGFEAIRDVRADGLTVTVRLKERFGAGPESFFPYVLPAHLLGAAEGSSNAPLWQKPVGCGPYRVVAWDERGTWDLVAHDASPRGEPVLRRLRVAFASGEQALKSFQSSPVPAVWMWPEASQQHALRRDGVGESVAVRTGRWRGLIFNALAEEVSSLATRRRFIAAYPLASLLREVVPVGTAGAVPLFTAAAGSIAATSSARAASGGELPTIDFSCGVRDGWPELSYDQLRVVEEAWATAGLPVRRQAGVVPFYRPWDRMGYLAKGRFQVAAGVFGGEMDPGWGGVFDPADAPSAEDPWGVGVARDNDPQVVRLYEQARVTYDRDERARIAVRLADALSRDAMVLVERAEERSPAVLGVKGYRPGAYPAGDTWNVEKWTLVEAAR